MVVSSIVLPAGNGRRGGASEEEQRMKEKEGKERGFEYRIFRSNAKR